MRTINPDLVIFGAGQHARAVAKALRCKGYRIHAFVSSAPANDEMEGVPILDWESLASSGISADIQMICAIFNRGDPYQELVDLAASHQFYDLVMPWDYYPILKDDLGWCYWLSPDQPELHQHKSSCHSDKYEQVLELLADEESQTIFKRIQAFRRGDDLPFSSYLSKEPQYFNNTTLGHLKGRPITYMDIGAYNGDTFSALVSIQEVSRAFLFEPDPKNYTALQTTLTQILAPSSQSLVSVEALSLGAGDKEAFVSLSGDGESASLRPDSAVNMQAGSRMIHVVRVDDIYPLERIDFIKIDAEGADLQALEGMKSLIRRSHPVLAVSLYHLPSDIVDLPLAVRRLVSGMPYQYFIRQHMFNSFESVLYAVPT